MHSRAAEENPAGVVRARRVFLLPGEINSSREPVFYSTLLGSCVSVCLYDRKANCGGMNHYMLSSAPAGARDSARYGDYAIDMLLRMMVKEGSSLKDIESCVLGGARVGRALSIGADIGAKNIVAAKEALGRHKIPVKRADVGGDYGRKIHFRNWTGEIDIRKVEKSRLSAEVESRKESLSGRKIRVLVVDDSPLVCDILEGVISENPDMEVVGRAADAFAAREMLLEHDPDVVTLDIIMPKMDGMTFLKKIMMYHPKPVIVISTIAKKDSKIHKQAVSLGAAGVIDKEELDLYGNEYKARLVLASRIKMASAVLVGQKQPTKGGIN